MERLPVLPLPQDFVLVEVRGQVYHELERTRYESVAQHVLKEYEKTGRTVVVFRCVGTINSD